MASLSDQVLIMKQSLENVESELKSLESGKKASAPRARKALQSLKQSSHSLRKQITENVKGMPVKSRGKKEPVQSPEVVQSPEDFKVEEEEEKPKANSSKKKAKPRAKSKKLSA
jgi:hypothetical protein